MINKPWVKYTGYGAFALGALFVSLYITFPAEAVGQRLKHEVQQKSGGTVNIEYEDVSLYRLSGLAVRGMKVQTVKEGQQPTSIRLDEVRARLRILPLLWLSTSFDTEVELGNGTIDARITPGKNGEMSAQIDIDDWNLAQPPVIPELAGVGLTGTVNGSFTADLRKDPKTTAGKGTLKIAKASFGPGTVHGFTVPNVDLGTLDVEWAVEAGKMRVTSFKQEGGQVQAKLSGSSMLRPELASSTIDGCVEVRAEPDFLEKNPNIKSALQLAEVQFKKGPQGFLNIPLTGSFSKVRTRGGLCRSSGHD